MMAMTENISSDAAARREAARVSGRFGTQAHTAPEVKLIAVPFAGAVDEQTRETLERKAAHLRENTPRYQPGDRVEAGGLEPGDEVLTETNTTHSPFSHALRTNRVFRRAYSAAGMPWKLTVVHRQPAAEDGRTDDEITFDVDGQEFPLTFHRERRFTIAR